MGASTKLFDTSASASCHNSNNTRTPKSRTFMSQDAIRFPSCPLTQPIFESLFLISEQSRLFKIKPTSSISPETALVQVKLISYKKFLKISKTNWMIFQDFGADQGKRQWSDLRYLSVLNPTRHVAIHLICGLFVTIFGQQIAIRKPLLRKYSIVTAWLNNF